MSAISKNFYALKTPEDTREFAAKLAGLCKIGDCILLYGEVGAGKTTFARGFIQAITGTQDEIVSPTFTLVQTYPLASGGAVWHCDLYRLKNKNEIFELGLDEAFESGIILVEWPEIAEAILPKNSLVVRLDMQGQGRSITLVYDSASWKDRLEKI